MGVLQNLVYAARLGHHIGELRRGLGDELPCDTGVLPFPFGGLRLHPELRGVHATGARGAFAGGQGLELGDHLPPVGHRRMQLPQAQVEQF